MTGAASYHAGRVAEDRVAARYSGAGHRLAKRRWRGKAGEIDLIFRGPEGVIFVEVKSSRTRDRAAAALSRRQIDRLMRAAEEFLDDEPQGGLTPVRFDVATVDGTGRIDILENAFA